MKTLKASCLALVFTLGLGQLSFATTIEESTKAELRNRIVKLIKNPAIKFDIPGSQAQAKIKFMVTEDNELVVISSGTDNEIIDEYVKARINYKKLNNLSVKSGIYTVKVTFVE